MINPDADSPVTQHTPIPVQLHWWDNLKARLDRGVQLGVLEPVLICEPLTVSRRMVIYPQEKWEASPQPQLLNAHTSC